MWLWGFGAVVLLTWLIFAAKAIPGLARSVSLTPSLFKGHSNPPTEQSVNGCYPRVTVVLAARNEAASLPATLASLRAQSWTNLEVIAVDDRSTDDTARVLDDAASAWQALKVVHITELPDDWLGKTYALHTAAKVASGEWLLFTDADVQFSSDAVDTAMRYTLFTQADHLALAPTLIATRFWLRAVVYFFLYNVVLIFRPQDSDRRNSSASVGIGAFNLVRKSVYEQIGGHARVALRTDEDLALGAVIKRAGFKQLFAGGTNLVAVEWYATLSEMARGLEKNALAPFGYHIWRFALGMLAMLLLYDAPAAGMLMADNWSRLLFAAAFATEMYLFHMTRRYTGVTLWWALTLPVAAPILCVILVRAAILCLVRGGIDWRGTFYSLRDLRKTI